MVFAGHRGGSFVSDDFIKFPGFWTQQVSPGVLVTGAGSKGQGPTAGKHRFLPPHGRNCIVWKKASGPEGRAAGCHRIPIFLTPPRVRYLLPPKSEHILQPINTPNSEPGRTLRRKPQRWLRISQVLSPTPLAFPSSSQDIF